MTQEEFDDAINEYRLDDEYAEFIMARSSIGNGDSLIIAMERGDYFEEFRDSMVDGISST